MTDVYGTVGRGGTSALGAMWAFPLALVACEPTTHQTEKMAASSIVSGSAVPSTRPETPASPARSKFAPRPTTSALVNSPVASSDPVTASNGAVAQAGSAPAMIPAQELTWTYPQAAFGLSSVVVSVPEHPKGKKFPVLIALHGMSEARKSPAGGARGWLDDYGMKRAQLRLKKAPLVTADFGGMVTAERLGALNRSLSVRPYRGVIVVTPYLPDVLRAERAFANYPALAAFYVDQVLPRVLKETPALPERRHHGIDGVSLGGRAALMIGLSRSDRFGAVGALQPALDEKELARMTSLASLARAKAPDLQLRLLTSADDYYLGTTQTLSARWDKAQIAHRLDLVQGDHSYAFNRGPGVYELLLHYDRVLRTEPYL